MFIKIEQQKYQFKSDSENIARLFININFYHLVSLLFCHLSGDLQRLGLIIECVLYSFIRTFAASYIQVRLIFESVL